ncbi:Crp/Fnr family transcriptional regulator [Sinomicrobium weinanense]|uniref:Crp/Fnr family transcriptional regulator n=1 Tax=Sinomicrobium weinanense TaxID=2842200 RepID=A0A926JVW1_9FLAO|nr:Crp/Fnr family transcriptional regulator [Sinomicrobium weinanense]MBC9798542.1 Crp/Fnr family transcriptional regulator [Sinomicrobium weinanense]MBU3122541.1 Crp/Fnr family transcriptional regulator [Sinomicrobium weinanense]
MNDNDIIEQFFEQVKEYVILSAGAKGDWASLLKLRVYEKGDYFIRLGQIPRKTAYVARGLFSQYYIDEAGNYVIKNFFPEGRLAGSVPATLTGKESPFAIEALEKATVLEFDFLKFKKLVRKHPCIADAYIQYMEKYWVIEKEPDEISFRNDTAAARYRDFLIKYPRLVKRLKKHHIASYLGITPTQLSRILFANK